MPDISVLMSVYNGEEFINESIDSILNQTYQDFEFIIVNDGSTDRTRDIIESYDDERIKLYNFEANQGVGPALNYGLSKARGKYIAKADADDIFISSRLEEQKDYLDKNNDVALVGGLIEFFPHNENVKLSNRYKIFKSIKEINKNRNLQAEDIAEKLYWYCCMNHTTIMGYKKIIEEVGYINLAMGTDYNLFYKLNKKGYKMVNLNKVFAKMRVTNTSITAQNREFYYRKSLFLIKKEEIYKLFGQSNGVYIWGAGSMGRNLLYALRENNLAVKGFIDRDNKKVGNKIKGKEIFSSDIIRRNVSENKKIIVASQPGKFDIANYLDDKGFIHLRDYLVYS